MKGLLTTLFLAVAGLSAWLAVAAAVRARTALDRLHAVSFAGVVTGLCVTAAAFATDGASDRAFKVLLLLAISLVTGAATLHATARATFLRDPEER